MRTWVIAAGVVVAWVGGAAAQQKPVVQGSLPPLELGPGGPAVKLGPADQAAANAFIVEQLVAAAQRATDLYNAGDAAGSSQVYDITLRQLVYFLQDAPLKARVLAALDRGVWEPDWAKAAVVLRKALNDVRNRLDRAGDRERPLFDRLGGRPAVVGAVRLAYEAASRDPAVNLDRDKEYPYTADRARRMQRATVDLIQMLSDQAEAKAKPPAPGPLDAYRARLEAELAALGPRLAAAEPAADAPKAAFWRQRADDLLKERELREAVAALRAAAPPGGTAAEMARAHRGLRVTDEEYDAGLRHLRDALAAYAVPDKEVDELMRAAEGLRPAVVSDADRGPR